MSLTADTNARPAGTTAPRELGPDEFARLLDQTMEQMAGVNRLLADR